MRIAVIGAGQMGAGIAYVAATNGIEVSIQDSSAPALARGRAGIERDLDDGVRRGKLDPAARDAASARVSAVGVLEDAVAGAELIIEAIVEDLAIKRAVLAQVEKSAPDSAVIATNTSALSVTAIMSALARPGRGVGMHFFNPVRAMRLCEVISGLETTVETLDRAREVASAMGKQVVQVRDSAGFVTSRINAVIGNEAFLMLEQRIASAEDIDRAVELGLNHPMGPLRMADLVGLDVRLAVMRELHRALGDKYRPAALLEQHVHAGRLGRKVGRGVYDYPES